MLRRSFIICIMLCAMVMLIAACGSGKKNSKEAEMLNKQQIEQLEKETAAQVTAEENKNEETGKQETITQIPVPKSDGTTTETGKYIGKVGNDSIQIKVSGEPDAQAPKTFILSEELKAEFSKITLEANDDVIFKYTMNENDQPVIVDIQILK